MRSRRLAVAGRVAAASGIVSLLFGLLLVPLSGAAASASPAAPSSATPSATASPSKSTSPTPKPSPTHKPRPKPHKHKPTSPHGRPPTPPGGVVVRGNDMWNPVTNKKFRYPSYVTVNQVTSLTNQTVVVTWRNFTPSSNVTYDPVGTDYPVMIAECTGTHPTSQSQCFGADNGGVQGSLSQFGPMNTVYATTSPNGTGQAEIQLLTAEQAPQLGCNKGHECSLVIEPSQGGNVFNTPPSCNDHSQDAGLTDIGSFAFTAANGVCSWRDRIIVPLKFSPTPTDCPVRNPNFSVIGSPMAARAMGSWQTALCSQSSPVFIQYDSAQAEPLARLDFASGSDDVALTTLPLSGASANRHFTYAPVAITAESVAYWVDNPTTGQPLTRMKLDPRLVLKLLTQSYNFENEGCGHGVIPTKGLGCDNAVDGDPTDLFVDPEFEKLNPHVASVGDGFQIPTVLSGQSDMTWELTSWIAANKDAKSFADGSFDPWGEHVNTDYLNMTLPINTLSAMDGFAPVAHRYDPFFPLSSVAQFQADNWYPATNYLPDTTGNFVALPPEIPGNRGLFAILDQADTAAFQMPAAAIENAAGNYVEPDNATMAAALKNMKTAHNGITQQYNFANDSKKIGDAYPLTMVIYAMVPTSGISKGKAAKIAEWLDYVANQGQHQGFGPGQLPPGYLPLTAAMRTQTLKAASEVLNQSGNQKSKASPSASAGTSGASPSASAAATASPTPTPSSSLAKLGLGYVSNPASSGPARYAVPILLIVGALLAVTGSFALALGRGSATAFGWVRNLNVFKVGLGKLKLPGRKS